MNAIKAIKAIKYEVENVVFDIFNNLNLLRDSAEEEVIQQINRDGYAVVEGLFDANWCTEAINAIEVLILEHSDKVWLDNTGADYRLFGANLLKAHLQQFYEHDFINRLLQTYERTTYTEGFTMAAKLSAVDGNLGSGGGWHRDDANARQTKAILYLSEVGEANGPFQYIKGSHKVKDVYRNIAKYGFDFSQNRFEEAEVNRILAHEPERLHTFCGSAGLLILTDTRGLHRGAPIQQGVRYALTNYNWTRQPMPQHVKAVIPFKTTSV